MLAHLCVTICFLVFPNSVAIAAARWLMKSKRRYASQWKRDRHTIDCSFLIAEYRSQRLRFICSKVLEKNEIVVYIGACKCQKHNVRNSI